MSDLVEAGETLHYKIEFINRGASRKGYYSTKKTTEALERLGYEVHVNGIISTVYLSGSREEILKARKEITNRLRIMYRTMPIKFVKAE